jgi:hypothetical protein
MAMFVVIDSAASIRTYAAQAPEIEGIHQPCQRLGGKLNEGWDEHRAHIRREILAVVRFERSTSPGAAIERKS